MKRGQVYYINFYPRSPCGERLIALFDFPIVPAISIHALLAESDPIANTGATKSDQISIHALLAESDSRAKSIFTKVSNFYPRSPCGERREPTALRTPHQNFYPRSPCGERQLTV